MNTCNSGGVDDNCLVQERVEQRSRKKVIHYIKIHVPWYTLAANAEHLLLRAPLQVSLSRSFTLVAARCVALWHRRCDIALR